MSSGKVHYEIYIKPPKGKWQFCGALESRDKALKQATELAGGGASVQVMKETLTEDGVYLSVRIFQEGDTSSPRPKSGKEAAEESLPCFKPQDLYSYESRKTIVRLLQDSLSRWKITSLELLHSPGNLERLESTGTVLQAAIQKIAIAQSQAGEGTIGERVKTLHKLVSDAMVSVYVDRNKNRLPTLQKKTIAELATQLATDTRRDYLFNAAITAHLEDCEDWDSKLERILELIKDVPADNQLIRDYCLNIIDGYVSEILTAPSAIKDIVGDQNDLGGVLQRLIELASGQIKEEDIASPGIAALNLHFGSGALPDARTAIIRRVLNDLKGPKRILQDSLGAEVKFLRRLGSKVAMASGNLIPSDEVLAAFRARSERLIAPSSLDAYLGEAENPAARVERVLYISDNIVGEANKRKLAGILQAMLESVEFNQFFSSSDVAVSKRLLLLHELQDKVLQSELEDARKQVISERLDTICFGIAESARLFDKVANGHNDPLAKCMALLKLAASNLLTRGKTRDNAQRMALGYIREPGVLKKHLDDGAGAESAAKIKELTAMLRDAGVDPQSVMARHAA
ncbi:MAG TPA: hypothetical protein VFW37_10650 [Alphaproteobacteria bacterium]|nr:hypothetical protein [Alphaproteobacteria bacterium]